MTVREMLARMDSDELSEWLAYERITGPLDLGTRIDVNIAMLASATYNMRRGKGQPAKKVSDFLIKWETARQGQTPEQMLAIAAALNRRMGGEDLRPPRTTTS